MNRRRCLEPGKTEGAGTLVWKAVYGGEFEGIQSIVENEAANEWARGARRLSEIESGSGGTLSTSTGARALQGRVCGGF
jgi:hypothetical protein